MVTNTLGESFVTLLDWALRWWLTDKGPGWSFVAQQVAGIRPVARWLAAVVLALAIIAVAMAVMLTRRGEHAASASLGLARFLLVLTAGWLTFGTGWAMSDALARWIVGGRPDVQQYVAAVTDALSGAEPGVATTLSVLGAAAALAFVAVSLARVVLAVLLAVGVPIVAAASVFRGGTQLRVAVAWIVAVLMFRPLASILYRLTHDLVTNSSEPIVVLLTVPLMFVLSAAMLPLVARLAAGGRAA